MFGSKRDCEQRRLEEYARYIQEIDKNDQRLFDLAIELGELRAENRLLRARLNERQCAEAWIPE